MMTRSDEFSETADVSDGDEPRSRGAGISRLTKLGGVSGVVGAAVVALFAVTVVLAGCNSHPVEYAELTGEFEREDDVTGASSQALDLLWVIDNSQSMCQEQNALGQQFEAIIEILEQRNADFNIGVTTTDPPDTASSLDPISEHGHLRSQPYPQIATQSACWYRYNDQGVPQNPSNSGNQWGDFQPVRNQIQKAVNCTKNPEQTKQDLRDRGLYEENSEGILIEPNDTKIACATGESGACNAMSDSQLANEIQNTITDDRSRALLPTPFVPDGENYPYRDIPKVLRASDSKYRNQDGSLKSEELRQDFACMSFVGVFGSTYEAGLSAAKKAVSPGMTGGAADLTQEQRNAYDPNGDGMSDFDPEAPNHGFLRRDARFAVAFVSDENDCSLNAETEVQDIRQGGCGDAVCYFPTKNEDQSPLDSTDKLREELLANLQASKGMSDSEFEDYQKDNVFAVSVHGEADKETISERPEAEDCNSMGADAFKSPSCSSQFGVAFTGDRYQDFLNGFPDDNRFPQPDASNQSYVCDGVLTSAFGNFDTIVPEESTSCIEANIRPCDRNGDGERDCPDYEFGDTGSGSGMMCQSFGETSRSFCDSSIRVELGASGFDNPEQALRDSGYCIEESIGATGGLEKKCVVDRSQYAWVDCGTTGIRLRWSNPTQARQATSGFETTIRYHRVETDDGESGPDATMMDTTADAMTDM